MSSQLVSVSVKIFAVSSGSWIMIKSTFNKKKLTVFLSACDSQSDTIIVALQVKTLRGNSYCSSQFVSLGGCRWQENQMKLHLSILSTSLEYHDGHLVAAELHKRSLFMGRRLCSSEKLHWCDNTDSF